MSALKKAVFLDRDGVLCEDTDYITSFEKLHIYPFAKKAVEQIHNQRHGADEHRQRHHADRPKDSSGHFLPPIL